MTKEKLDRIESIAFSHTKLSEQLDTNLRKMVKYRSKENQILKKQVSLMIFKISALMKLENLLRN